MTFSANRSLLFLFTGLLWGCQVSEGYKGTGKRTIIELQLSDEMTTQRPANFEMKENMEIAFRPVIRVENSPPYDYVEAKVSKNKVKWEFLSDKPIEMNYGFGKLNLVSPGDSIRIKYHNDEPFFIGRGANKLMTWKMLLEEGKRLGIPTKNCNTIHSINDYLNWSRYLDQKLSLLLPILDSNKAKLQPFEYNYLKSALVGSIENDRIDAYTALRKHSMNDSASGITASNLIAVWDSTQYKHWGKWLRGLPDYYGSTYTLSRFNQMETLRKLNFDVTNEKFKSKEELPTLFYNNAKQNYNGVTRERLLALILDEVFIDGLGFNNTATQAALMDYYRQPGFPEYKQMVKGLEGKSGKLVKK
ncbi:hypothetical protein A3860_07635 [Niastella vici]|uniref:Uncharacterized protein n=1 Tax=Niastella vici TaxID=1703345 RepID=A0A1V9FIT1_9BACT|nr:hypothetical protein [Niastella vici]OQP58187.1 hypothetical protein A3860_07635 [Niastella vici]